MRSDENRASNRARTARRSSFSTPGRAAYAASMPSTTTPLTPLSITSDTEPQLNARTGVPQAMASIITRPKGSGQSIGKEKCAGAAEKLSFLTLVDLADELDARLAEQRLDDVVEIDEVGLVDLGRDFQRNAGLVRDHDGAVETLLRADAADESKIAAIALAIGQKVLRQAVMNGFHPVRARQRISLIVGDRNQRRIAELAVDRPQGPEDPAAREAW